MLDRRLDTIRPRLYNPTTENSYSRRDHPYLSLHHGLSGVLDLMGTSFLNPHTEYTMFIPIQDIVIKQQYVAIKI